MMGYWCKNHKVKAKMTTTGLKIISYRRSMTVRFKRKWWIIGSKITTSKRIWRATGAIIARPTWKSRITCSKIARSSQESQTAGAKFVRSQLNWRATTFSASDGTPPSVGHQSVKNFGRFVMGRSQWDTSQLGGFRALFFNSPPE